MNNDSYDVSARLKDLQNQSERRYMHTESGFLNEEELAEASVHFPESALIRYDGGYPGARKKKVIFLRDEEDDFSDIVCIRAKTDQRFRSIGHRDILGALMSLQIERRSFGDFWIEDGSLSVSFEITDEHPVQTFHTRQFEAVAGSERLDALVAVLAKVSRTEAQRMIRQERVQVNHRTLVQPAELCDNNSTISIRGTGRFTYLGVIRRTRKDRIVVGFTQYI